MLDQDAALAEACRMAQQFEGFSATPYMDPTGTWTIGYGFTFLGDGERVSADTAPITEGEASALVLGKMSAILAAVQKAVTVPLNTNQAAALSDFAYNLGLGALRESTLLRLFNDGQTAAAANEFPKWVYGGGRILPGLVRRREAERALFLEPV